jgi:hypothetical protein
MLATTAFQVGLINIRASLPQGSWVSHDLVTLQGDGGQTSPHVNGKNFFVVSFKIYVIDDGADLSLALDWHNH